ncbi:hypothetical protein ACIBQ0_17080 [Nocardia nova]|uniref:hypothetical protein n=1 Tax=Nocardia nova TaxID=37330 RepID=UPI0037ACD620
MSEKATCPECGLHSSNLYYTGVCTNRCGVPRPNLVEFINARLLEDASTGLDTAARAAIDTWELMGENGKDFEALAWIAVRDGIIKPIAAIWSDHPDYQQEWAA